MAGIYHLHIFDKNGIELVQRTNPDTQMSEADLYMGKVSTGLVETDNIILAGEDPSGNLIPISEVFSTTDTGDVPTSVIFSKNFRLSQSSLDSPNDLLALVEERYIKLLLYIDTESQQNLRFFTVDTETNEITWTNKILVSASEIFNQGIHLGFTGEQEGVYETIIYFCEVDTNAIYAEDIKETDTITPISQLKVHNVTVGEDTRYRDMFRNFGIPDPITYLDVFKDSTIFVDSLQTESEKNEYYRNHPNYHKYDAKMDYEFLNEKSKELYLSYSEIFPYVGTYKALINAVDYLGYDDVYFKEWFKELSDNPTLPSKNVSYEVAYKSGGRSLLTSLPLDRRISLKKLNWLSMIYKISEYVRNEKGEIEYEDLPDNVRVPLTRNNYSDYEANEILIKLISLKEWLEKNIIGLNCRIIEINGEGIVIGRYKHRIYGKTTVGSLYRRELSVTPFLENTNSELEIRGEEGEGGKLLGSMCKLRLGLREQNQMKKEEFLEKYKKVQFKAYLETKNGAFCSREIDGITYGYTDVPIIIEDGEIFFDTKNSFRNKGSQQTGNEGGSEAVFIKLPIIQLEGARLKNLSKAWKSSTEYVIDNEGPDETPFRLIRNAESIEDDNIFMSKDYITLRPHPWTDPSGNVHEPSLKYTTNNQFGVPLFIIENYLDEGVLTDETEIEKFLSQKYILEILDGKFVFNDDCVSEETHGDYSNHVTKTTYINFNYDEKELEQHISINYVYSKIVDMEDYANSDRTYLDTMSVQNIGDYTIVAFACDEYNTIYCNQLPQKVTVYMRNPSVRIYTAQPNSNNKDDFYGMNMDGSLMDYFSSPLTEMNVDEGATDNGGVDDVVEDSMFYLFLDNNECKMQETYLIPDVSVVDSSEGGHIVKYATYPTISYAIDTPKNNNIAHFMNISDKFYYVGSANQNDKNTGNIYYVEPDETNSNILVNDKYIIVWLRRNRVFEGNTLNDGIGPDADNGDLPAIKDANILIYDKIHNETVYQDAVKLNYCNDTTSPLYGLNYIILNESVMSDIYMYYKEGNHDEGAMQILRYELEPIDDKPKVQIEKTPDFDVTTVSEFLQRQRVFEYYIIPRYELPVWFIAHYNEDRNTSTIFFTEECLPKTESLFKVGDKVKIKYSTKVGENVLTAQATFTVIDSNRTSITIDGYYSYGRLSNEKYFAYKFASPYPSSPIAQYVDYIEEGTSRFRRDTNYTLKDIEMPNPSRAEEIDYLLVSHANCAYVDYEIPVDYAIEKPNGDTELHVQDDEYLYFIDNTFSIATKDFSTHTAFNLWMKENYWKIGEEGTPDYKEIPIAAITTQISDTEWTPIYQYTMPVTLPLDSANIVITPSTTYENDVQTFSRDLNERHSYWRLYKYDKYDDKNVLLFESWNDALFLTLNEEGLYSVELSLFDNYGNVINRTIEGIFKVSAN